MEPGDEFGRQYIDRECQCRNTVCCIDHTSRYEAQRWQVSFHLSTVRTIALSSETGKYQLPHMEWPGGGPSSRGHGVSEVKGSGTGRGHVHPNWLSKRQCGHGVQNSVDLFKSGSGDGSFGGGNYKRILAEHQWHDSKTQVRVMRILYISHLLGGARFPLGPSVGLTEEEHQPWSGLYATEKRRWILFDMRGKWTLRSV